MVETRHAPRYRASKAATIGSGREAINCIIRDLSTTGAAITLDAHVDIPDRFTLAVPQDDLNLSCYVVWRRGYRIGVTFE